MFTEKTESIPDADEASDDLSLVIQLQSADSLDAAYRARNMIVERYLGLVAATVRRIVPLALRSYEDDARQEASCALIEVAASFDPKRGVPFHAYAAGAMANRVRDYLARHANLAEGGRFGRGLNKVRKFIARDGRALEDLADVEVSAGTGLPCRTVRQLRPWLNPTVQLDAELSVDDDAVGSEVGAFVANGATPIPEAVGLQDAGVQLRRLVATLHWKDRYLLTRIFGMDGGDPVTISEAVVALGFSQQRGSVRLHRALERLRQEWRD